MTKTPLTLCLWYEGDAEEAAAFYAETFADTHVGAVNRAPADSPGGKEGDVQTVEFTLLGTPCAGLNGAPIFKPSEAFRSEERRVGTSRGRTCRTVVSR